MVVELSREVEMALTSKWLTVVGDEFDIVVSDCCWHSYFRKYISNHHGPHCFVLLGILAESINCLFFSTSAAMVAVYGKSAVPGWKGQVLPQIRRVCR